MAMAVQGGGGGRGSGRRGRRRAAPMSEINVTPMVDVMLVLLIVFMVAAPLLATGIEVDLPQAAAPQLTTPSDPVQISVRPDGSVLLEDQPMEVGALAAALEQMGVTTDQRILLNADMSSNYGRVAEVMGALSLAGYAKIGLPTAPPPGQ